MGCKAYRKVQIADHDYEVVDGNVNFAKYAVVLEGGGAAILPSFNDGRHRYKPVGGVPVITVAHDLNLAVRGQIERVAFEGGQRVYIVWLGHTAPSDPILLSEGEIIELANAFEYGVSGDRLYDIRLREGSLTGKQNFGEMGAACFMFNEVTSRWEVADMMP